MGGLIQRIRAWWQGADRTQKLITVSGTGVFMALVLATFVLASKPKMSLIFTNLSPEDTGNVAMAIESMGIPCDYDTNGNVQVPSDKVAKVRAELAIKNQYPKAGHSFGADLFKDVSPMVDPSVRVEELKAIEEGQLSEAIQVFDGVTAANVQITPAVDSPFDSDKKPAQANVTISESPGAMVSGDEARAMANLVASSVQGLDKSKVTIFTRTGRALWDGADMDSGSSIADSNLDLQKQESRKKRDELQEALNRMLGPGNAIAMVDVTLDLDQKDEVDEIHTGQPVPAQQMTETMGVNGSGANQGPSGQPSNTFPPAAGPSTPSKSSYTLDRKQNDPELWPNTTKQTIKHGVGQIKAMSVTVLVNQPKDKQVYDPTNPNDPIKQLALSALPPHDRNDPAAQAEFTANVVAYPFDTTQADEAKTAAASAAGSGRMAQILSMLPIAALLLVGFFVIKAIGKLAGRPMPTTMLAAAGGPALPMSSDGSHLFASAFQPAAGKPLDAANRFVLPEIVKQKALEAGISEEQLQAAIEEAGDAGISVEDIPSIKNKINVPLEQIKKMASERPETVAMMIKSWLIEEGIRR
ncbi:MAG TPA: flagellar M-ring protein FliF C-terminal domain-containing protein [Fimbriimonadaceae bacterium]|nr:flagellar M-ring protein FliF C-terminal domain-containing protein [Fimbriimonadaceae bacterium]